MRRTLSLVAALSALAIAGPAAAEAATLSVSSGTSPQGSPYYYLIYSAAPGEDNDLQIDDAPGGKIVFDDVVQVAGACNPGKPDAPADTTARTCSAVGLNMALVYLTDGRNEADARDTSQDLQLSGDGPQPNTLYGGSGDDYVYGGSGSDELYGQGGVDQLWGGAAADRLDGGLDSDQLHGEAGVDAAAYSAHPSGVTVTLDDFGQDGSPGENDNVWSDVENFLGSDWDDTFVAQEGSVSNAVHGGPGKDTILAKGGNDITLDGGAGDDKIHGGDGNDGLYAGAGDDGLDGGPDNDLLHGEADDDILLGATGTDIQFGGDGDDTISYLGTATRVWVDLEGDADDGIDGEDDRVGDDVENIVGGNGPDLLYGNDLANVIRGGDGNDFIVPNGGSDQIFGDGGDDTIGSYDGVPDLVDCGADSDRFEVDALDTLIACEIADPGSAQTGQPTDPTAPAMPTAPSTSATPADPAGPAPGPVLRIRPLRLRLTSSGVARLRVQCPAAARERCTGTLRLKRGKRTLGRRRFSIASGASARVTVGLSRADRRAIPPAGIRVRAVASARDAASAARISRSRLRLLPARVRS